MLRHARRRLAQELLLDRLGWLAATDTLSFSGRTRSLTVLNRGWDSARDGRHAFEPACRNFKTAVSTQIVSDTQHSPHKKDLAAMFTCGVCDTRVLKTFSRSSYERGVVLVKCPSCQNQHVIADRLGWFGEPGSVENYMAEKGEEVRKRFVQADGTCELTAEDIAGWSQGKSTTDRPD